MPVAPAQLPWFKHRWPWIIIVILTCSVTLSLTMVTIAVSNPDPLVNDNYYEAGKGINRALERERLGQALHLRASVHLDELSGEVALRLSGDSQPPSLELNLISPTQPARDRRISLVQSSSEPGRYIGQLDDNVLGRRFVELLGSENGHIWRLFEQEHISADNDLTLGDEALQGAQGISR